MHFTLHRDMCGSLRDTWQNGLFYSQQIAYNMHFKSVENHNFFTVFKQGSSMGYV